MDRMTTASYLGTIETNRRRELVRGVLREPPAPLWDHQRIVTDLALLLHQHTRARGAGEVTVAPVDVVLDEALGLVLQPDIVFITRERLDIVRGQVWGAPDLVIEVLSFGTLTYDRGRKLEWFREYGVRECWLVDPIMRRIIVHRFAAKSRRRSTYGARGIVRSAVLPELRLRVADVMRRELT